MARQDHRAPAAGEVLEDADRMVLADTGSTASNGSSSTSSRGACTSAQASVTFLVMPAE